MAISIVLSAVIALMAVFMALGLRSAQRERRINERAVCLGLLVIASSCAWWLCLLVGVECCVT